MWNSASYLSSCSLTITILKESLRLYPIEVESGATHKAGRGIDLRIRFKVTPRDNFKCCACGASLAKDLPVESQINHIRSWAEVKETVIANTLLDM